MAGLSNHVCSREGRRKYTSLIVRAARRSRIKADVFPAEWSDVGEQRVGQNLFLDAKLGDGAAEIDGFQRVMAAIVRLRPEAR